MLLKKIKLQNFRGFGSFELELDKTTVLIGENNSGKSAILDALRICLGKSFSRRNAYLDDYDYHLHSKSAGPGEAGQLSITLEFSESDENEWSEELIQALGNIVTISKEGTLRHVTLRVHSTLDPKSKEFVSDWEFLNAEGNALAAKTKKQQELSNFQQIRPVFYLSAVRDASKEFQLRSNYWAPFLRNPSLSAEERAELEKQIQGVNAKLLESHTRLKEVKTHLNKAQEMVSLGGSETVNIEALPGRLFDLMDRTQVNVATRTDASIPLIRHGAGTQSLSVIFLFEAFVRSMLTETYDKLSEPILALEEPEAHLHPCAIRGLWRALEAMPGQKLITTHSGDLMACVPLTQLRRLHRVGGKIEVRSIKDASLDADELRKLHYHVRSTRGELLFARCWLLVEGESEYWAFTEEADILGDCDLEALAIRIVPYRQADVGSFIKMADALGIAWHCVADDDQEGKKTQKSVQKLLNGRSKADLLTLLSQPNIELLLCHAGYGEVYEANISKQKKHDLTLRPDDAGYWEQVMKCQGEFSKPEFILKIMETVRSTHESSKLNELNAILRKTQHIAEKCK